ncbi:MAG: hypothetical protein M0T70_05040 [Geobacteraceae bacterium]|nr:hypothetical protein [Geobacteraceae bacterium]
MISVVVYGRNDSYGYNLAKRAAISLNCIAHILDDSGDEIIFVDCNTPNDIPTFPESIADTLTPRAKRLLRVLRLRPEQYERGKNGAKFKVLEPLCRNVAIRRTNPANRWILNTNTDMVFTPLQAGMSLSRVVADLPDGFYELPRFEMPESLWESTDRMDTQATIKSFKHWGLRFHIDEVVTASPETLFDGPGDFQLALRSQLFQIHGMNEQMVLGWHVDSNLCKRMWLLNGKTRTILDRLHAFHCDHTRIQTVYHVAGRSTENSLADFFVNVTTPFVPEQATTWGMPDEEIEEIRLDGHRVTRIQASLERILPGMERPITGLATVNSFDVGLHYDNLHVFSYIADIIINFSPGQQLGYFGGNAPLLGMLVELRRLLGHTGQILYYADLLRLESTTTGCIPASRDQICKEAGSYLVDLSMKHLPARANESGLPIPDKCPEVVQFAREMSETIIALARHEKEMGSNSGLLKPAIFVGCHSTTFDEIIKHLFSCAMTPANTYVRNGVLSPEAFSASPPIMPLHFYVIGSSVPDIVSWISGRLGRPVTPEEVRMAQEFYTMFVEAKDRQRMLDALETLLSFDAGRGWLQMQIEIAGINGVPEHGEALQAFIENYRQRWHGSK